MQWQNATLVRRQFWTETLFSIEVESSLPEYQAGQFAQLGLTLNGELVKRAYSFVNPPHRERHEFYLVNVAGGLLSPKLATLEIGETLQIAERASGFFTLSELPDNDTLVMLATGTAIGPYLAMLQTVEPWQRFSQVILIHGVRFNQDIAYKELISSLGASYPQFKYVPFVSREKPLSGFNGRITDAIAQDGLTQACGFPLEPAHCQIMICGNPQMVKDSRELFAERGFTRHLRRKPGQLLVENYW